MTLKLQITKAAFTEIPKIPRVERGVKSDIRKVIESLAVNEKAQFRLGEDTVSGAKKIFYERLGHAVRNVAKTEADSRKYIVHRLDTGADVYRTA